MKTDYSTYVPKADDETLVEEAKKMIAEFPNHPYISMITGHTNNGKCAFMRWCTAVIENPGFRP